MIEKTISHYKIIEKLGEGGMGVVYRAQDTKLEREVAIKVLPEEFGKDFDRLARFEREAKLLASLNHPNIATIYGFEESDGEHFLALELVEGETIADQLSSGPLKSQEALEICRQIAEALESAHEKGIIHRDLKPSNVKVTPEGQVKVLDFGLAKAFEVAETDKASSVDPSKSPTITVGTSRSGVILGTAAYMSPEQAFLMEKPHLTPLPSHIPAVYETLYRTVDVEGYVRVNTNRYSVPERLIGKQVEVHKSWDRVHVFFNHKKVADHSRLIAKRETRVTAKGHHSPLNRSKAHKGPSKEEMILRGQDTLLDDYVKELKKRSKGRGQRKMRKLLELKRTYPEEAFKKALKEAYHYGLYDLHRLEEMILSCVAGEFFKIDDDDDA
ncbi:MAG: serine/threonine protein kinase [Candidatus Aminicenantes bacterium]|nr:serine/threonine protein kinase [Candidatus Aminicenantes bacterium]